MGRHKKRVVGFKDLANHSILDRSGDSSSQAPVPVKGSHKKSRISLLTNEEISDALTRCHGLYYLCAEALGVSKSALVARITNDIELESIAKDQRGKMLDKAESKLMEAVENGEQWAIQLMLKTLGRDRGYVERQELHSVNQVRVQVVEEIVDARASPEVVVSVASPSFGRSVESYKPRGLPETFNDGEETGGN